MTSQQNAAAQQHYKHLVKTEIYQIDITFTVLAFLGVLLRFWARHRSVTSYGWDDWLVLISMLIVFINFALNAVLIEHGLGIQSADVPPPSLVMIGKIAYGHQMVYVVALAVIKSAVLIMYCRVFPLRSIRVAAWILGTVTVVWSLISLFLIIFQCRPIPHAWNVTLPGSCLNLRAVFISNAVQNISTDVAILIMPMHQVWKLQVRKAQRIALTSIFLLGAFVIATSSYRSTTILKLDRTNLSYALKSPATWSHIEVSVALICACLPMMRPLLTAFLRLAGRSKTTQRGQANEYIERGESSGMQRSTKKKPSSGLSEFEVLDEGQDGWSTPKAGSNDELPLNVVQMQRFADGKCITAPQYGIAI